MMLHIENGTHTQLSYVEYYKCKAFKLEPKVEEGPQGHLSVDGQVMDACKVEVSINNSMLNVLCK